MASCGHCGSSAEPARTERLDRRRLLRALDAAVSTGITAVAFTGGEPLAHRTLTFDGVAAAHELGLHTTVCTNAFWAGDAAAAGEVLDELLRRGLNRLHLSTDRWHVDFIPAERVVLAAELAMGLGFEVQVAIPAGRNDWRAFELLDMFSHLDGLEIAMHPAHAVGRGEFLPASALQPAPPALAPCHLAGHVEVDFDGRASICPTSADFGPDSVLRIGSVDHEDFAHHLARRHDVPLTEVISRWGPVGVAVLAGRAESVAGFTHDCHLCRALHSDAGAAEAIELRTGIDVLRPVDASSMAAILETLEQVLAAELRPTEVAVGFG